MIAVICTLVLAIFSGWRDVGIDRANYLSMYIGIISNDDWPTRFWYAKDILFLTIALLSNYISDDPRLAFLIICLFSSLLKYYSISRMAPQYTLPFILFYSLFLAPGLELAAMRGALAIGFFMLAVAYYDKKFKFTLFSALTVMAHLSTALPVLFAISQINLFLSKYKWAFIAIGVTTSISTGLLLSLMPHGLDYEDNHGTLLAYSEPLATLFSAGLIFFKLDRVMSRNPADKTLKYLQIIRPIVYGLIAIAFGMTGLVVTAATRYLEISWCFLLFVAIVMFKKSYLNMIGGLIFLMFLSYINVVRLTWAAIINPNLT